MSNRRIPEQSRGILARFRTGSHCLGGRTARFEGMYADARCKCGAGIESEYHFIFSCRLYKEVRLDDPDLFGSLDMTTPLSSI